jgi:hypothetical protein
MTLTIGTDPVAWTQRVNVTESPSSLTFTMLDFVTDEPFNKAGTYMAILWFRQGTDANTDSDYVITSRQIDEGSNTIALSAFTHLNGESGATVVDITGMTTRDLIQSAINNALNAGEDVRVTGTVTGITQLLTLDIPTGRTVTWEASYTGGEVRINGAGNFIIANGGTISRAGGPVINLSTFGGNFTIGNNGTIINTGGSGNSQGIGASSSNSPVIRILNGGRLEAPLSAIATASGSNGTFLIEGGTVHSKATSATEGAITLQGSSRLHVSGGTISKEGTGRIIDLRGAQVYVSGTPTIAENGIERFDGGTAYYSGDNLAKFRTSGSNAFIVGTNLHNETPAWAE